MLNKYTKGRMQSKNGQGGKRERKERKGNRRMERGGRKRERERGRERVL
jgi:hypothetical protein